jgi:hypothetical protein
MSKKKLKLKETFIIFFLVIPDIAKNKIKAQQNKTNLVMSVSVTAQQNKTE